VASEPRNYSLYEIVRIASYSNTLNRVGYQFSRRLSRLTDFCRNAIVELFRLNRLTWVIKRFCFDFFKG
jgi:hypothetical protein